MKKQKLKKKYWQRRKEHPGKRQREVTLLSILLNRFEENYFSGIFQNIHDSFDEIDSKTLNSVYKKSQSSNSGKILKQIKTLNFLLEMEGIDFHYSTTLSNIRNKNCKFSKIYATI